MAINYDKSKIRKLKEAAEDVDKVVTSNDKNSDNSPEPNYKCVVCGEKTNISDHKRRAKAWCDSCGGIKSHERLSD